MVRTTTLSPLEFIPGEYMCKQQPPTWRAYRVTGVPQGLPCEICPITPLKEFHSRATLRMRKLRLRETTRPASDRTGAGGSGGSRSVWSRAGASDAALRRGRWDPGRTGGNPRPRGCPLRGRAERGRWVWGGPHLDDERILKHGIPHDPQPLVLHARPDVGHGQGPPRGWADLADGAVDRRLLLLPSREVLAGVPGLWHPGGSPGVGPPAGFSALPSLGAGRRGARSG